MWDWAFKNERWLLPLVWTAIVVGAVQVNVFSLVTETEWRQADIPVWRHYVMEYSSGFTILLLIPCVSWLVMAGLRFAKEWWQFIVLMMAGAVVFSIVHVFVMITLRVTIFPLFGVDYHYPASLGIWIYEFRKDVVTYVTIVSVVLLISALRDARLALLTSRSGEELAAQPQENRLSFRTGASTIWVKPDDILYAQAAGNYVELHLSDGKSKLLRQTLTGLESALEEGQFARTHRSYLVRKAAVRSLEPTGNGDYVAELDGARKVPVSRRYREALSPAAS